MEGPIKAQGCAKTVPPSRLVGRTEMRSEGIMARKTFPPRTTLPCQQPQAGLHTCPYAYTSVHGCTGLCMCGQEAHADVCIYVYVSAYMWYMCVHV